MQQNKFKNSDERFRIILNSAVEAIITINNKGIIQDVNPAVEKITGFTPDELIGENVRILMPEPYHSQHDTYMESYKKTAKKKIIGIGREVKGIRKNGEIYPIDLSVNEMEIDGEKYFVGIFRDISERKKAEIDLQKSEERFILASMGANDFLWDWEIEENKLWITPRFFETTAIKTDSFETLYNFFDHVYADDRKYLKSLLQKHLEEQEKFDTVYRIKSKDNQLRWHQIRGQAIWKNDKAYRMSGSIRDVTELMLAKEKISIQNEELLRSNKELQNFAYIASHDLQEPLRKVISFTELLNNEMDASLSNEQKQYMKFIIDGGKRMRILINDLLDYSRISRKETEYSKCNLNNILSLVKDDLAVQINETKAQIDYENLPSIEADFQQIYRVFQNLINNALKYRSKDAPKIEIGYKENDKFYTFYVKDNGIGIDPEFHERIFVIFQRLHRKSDIPGTGIGLAICSRIIQAHGGKIWVESKLNQGSVFYFTLPKERKKHGNRFY